MIKNWLLRKLCPEGCTPTDARRLREANFHMTLALQDNRFYMGLAHTYLMTLAKDAGRQDDPRIKKLLAYFEKEVADSLAPDRVAPEFLPFESIDAVSFGDFTASISNDPRGPFVHVWYTPTGQLVFNDIVKPT